MEFSDIEASMVGPALERLVEASGLPLPSFRAVGLEIGVAHSTVAEWFGSKDVMLLRCAREFTQRYRIALARTWAEHGVVALASPGVAAGDLVRARSLWVCWARAAGAVALIEQIHGVEREELRSALYWETSVSATDAEVTRAHAEMVGSWDLGVCLLNPPNVRSAA